jgi:tetratricopeptide (TPR) repeat protein
MASIVPGYEYDIFISYRHNDNRSGWVTEFVEALQEELAATLKDPVSVYFDTNPHDGLLETHNVDKSLEGKLKCLIFIPIISQTYCDSKSFAWQYEFTAFNKIAKEDRFGRDIRLGSGNVASRILPVKIHDLDEEDKTLLENELGAVLRSIDFIYKSSGVNRSLKPNDGRAENLNHTYYRDQINKVANAVKEIITAIKKNNLQNGEIIKPILKAKSEKQKKLKTKHILYVVAAVLILMGFINFNQIIKILNQKKIFIRGESIITVESVNITRDTSKILDPKIIEYLLRYNISNKSNLTLLNFNQFNKIYPPNNRETSLPQKNIICKITNGDFGYQIDYKIIDNNRNGSVSQGKVIFHNPTNLLEKELDKITSSLATKIPKKNFLTEDWDALENFYEGEINWNVLNVNEARKFFKKSISIDPAFLLPCLRLASICHFEGNNKAAIDLLNTLKASINNLTIQDSIRTIALWNTLNGKTREAINNYKRLIEYLPAQKEPYFELAEGYFYSFDINNAISNYRKALDFDPEFSLALNHLGYSFSQAGQHDSALKYFKKYTMLKPPIPNAYDSYGDGFLACGKLDSAKWAKLKGLELDSTLDYIYWSLFYVNIREGRLKEAEKNTNKYLHFQTAPVLISTGLSNKAFIYLINHEFRKSLDTCLKAKSIFDSNYLATRNHILHWILSRIYFKTNNSVKLHLEMHEMKYIISRNNIDEFNYNMIYKFYQDINIRILIKAGKIDKAKEIITVFDNEIYNKIEDWGQHYDVAFFNTEFGKLFLETNHVDLAKERFLKALAYNPNYSLAHYYLSLCYKKMNLPAEEKKHLEEFDKMIPQADKEYIDLLISEKI